MVKITDTEIEGVYVIEPEVFEDQRGYFMESFNMRGLKLSGKKIDLGLTGYDELFMDDKSRAEAKLPGFYS